MVLGLNQALSHRAAILVVENRDTMKAAPSLQTVATRFRKVRCIKQECGLKIQVAAKKKKWYKAQSH